MAIKTLNTLFVAALALIITGTAEPATSYRLVSTPRPNTNVAVKATYEVGGTLTIPGEKKSVSLPMKVAASVEYQQRLMDASLAKSTEKPETQMAELIARRSIRHYGRAEAKINVGDQTINSGLRSDRRLIAVDFRDATATLYSPSGALTREELDLIKLPGDVLFHDLLLPSEAVTVGSTWNLDESALALLMGLDAVGHSDVLATLKEARGRYAVVELKGTVDGAIEGVATQIEMKSRYYFDLNKRRITSLQLVTKEKREIGHVTPGVDVVAKLRLSLEARAEATKLSDGALRNVSLEPTADTKRLSFVSQTGHYRFQHSRNWHVTMDEGRNAILRFMDRGDLVAQCNIVASRMESKDSKESSLKDFEQSVTKAIGDPLDEILTNKEWSLENGLRVFRVEAEGEVSELPVRWLYYLLTEKGGRRATLVFTMEESLIDQFAEAEKAIISTFEMLPESSEKGVAPTPLAAGSRIDSKPKAKSAPTSALRPRKSARGNSKTRRR